ncbi:MAG: hypothetical protein AB2A00_25345 [Myxococcota bacterium]
MFATTSRKLMLLAVASQMTLACGPQKADFSTALPSDEAVTIRVPGSEDEGGSSTASSALVGDVSEFYVHTYRISRYLNGHVVALLREIRNITQHEPTSVEGEKAIWGPYTPGGLEPLTYRLTAEKIGENQYALNLEARRKQSAAEEDYRSLIDGQVQGSGQEDGRGQGVLVLHFDAAGDLNPAVLERGEIQISFNSMQEPRSIDVDFIQFANADDRNPHDATYRYAENEDHSGTFLFSIQANIHKHNENKPGLETMTLRSSWVGSGAGRGDVTVSGAEVAADLSAAGLTDTNVRATECWGEDMTVVFQDTVPAELREEIRPLDGEESACAVAASYPDPV